MNLRIVKPVNITGDSDQRKNFDSNKTDENNRERIKVIDQNPKNFTVNFNNDEILLTFNKLIYVNSNLIKLQSTFSKNNVVDIFSVSFNADQLKLKFKNKPAKDETYIITFLEGSVIDRNRNSVEEFSLIFSTGNKVDDLRLRGTVYDLMTKKEANNVYVFLYKLNPDEIKNNIPTRNITNNNKPNYFTKTNLIGYYNFENLSPGVYFLCAGEIDNDNFLSDSNIHKYGFESKFIKIDKNSNNIENNIYILKSLISNFKITNEYYINSKYYIEINDKIKDYKIDIQNKFKNKYTHYSNLLKKAVNLVKENVLEIDNNVLGLISTDFLPCELTVNNIIGDNINKNLLIKFDNNYDDDSDDIFNDNNNNNIDDKYTENKTKEFEIKPSENDLSLESLFNFEINMKKNIISTNKDNINIVISDDYNIIKKSFTDFNIIEETDKIYIKTDKKMKDIIDEIIEKENNKNYEILKKGNIKVIIFINNGTFTYSDFTKNKSDMNEFVFLKEFKSLNIKFNKKTDHFKLQLLNEDYNIIKEIEDTNIKDRNNIVLNKIKEGKYFLRYFLWNTKKDGENKWFPGNINKNIPNDPLDIYGKPILVNKDSEPEKIIIE